MSVASIIDLIVAPATPPRPAARAIVRLTGEGSVELLGRLFTAADGGPLAVPATGQPPRRIELRLHPDSLGRDWGELPVAMLFWPGPAGPLGAAAAEIQLPGSPLLQAAVVEAACRLGARLARGGEFSLRSFLAGKIDLLEAEAVVAVVEARTPAELAAALDRMAGGVGRQLEQLRGELLDLVADVEAAIDFADDLAPDAVPVAEMAAHVLLPRLTPVLAGLDAVADNLTARDASGRTGLPRVVLAGPPNIGKSSLFNALLGREAALVEDAAGTTRDWIGGELADAAGVPVCQLIDLAGVLHSPPQSDGQPDQLTAAVEAAADRVAREEIRGADIVLLCRDAVDAEELPVALPAQLPRLTVITRADRLPAAVAPTDTTLPTSTATGEGIEHLRRRILDLVRELPQATPATLRLRAGITAAREPLDQARQSLAGGSGGLPPDEALLAVLLRQAIDALGEVTGAVIGTDIIDRVFSRHCIGK